MVKKILETLLLMLLPITASAIQISGGLETSALYINTQEYKNVTAYMAKPSLGVSFSSSSFKAEISGSYLLSASPSDKAQTVLAGFLENGVSLDKAYFKFRFPSFGGQKLTITAGKAPVSWGMGSYYRIGDTLFDDYFANDEIGKDQGRQIWLLTLSQNLGAGFSVDLAFAPPLKAPGKKEKLGVLVKKNFNGAFLKQARLSYSYGLEGTSKASFIMDSNLFFDMILGVESTFKAYDDIKALVNISKSFSADTETESYPMSVYICSLLDFKNSSYSILPAFSIGFGQRTILILSVSMEFKQKDFIISPSLLSSFILSDGVEIRLSTFFTNPDSWILGAEIGLNAYF